MKAKSHGNGLPFEILKWALLLYTAYRSLDILGSTMPDGNILFAIPALLGLDVGVLVWSYLYEKRAEGNQATLAALLTVLDLVGVGLCLIADSIMHSALRGQYEGFVQTVSVWLVAIVIFFNVVGGVLYPMFSPQAERDRKEKEMNASYDLLTREAQHKHQLATIELQNARIHADARALTLEATGTFNMPAGKPRPTPSTTFGKDVEDAGDEQERADFLAWKTTRNNRS